MYTYLILGNHLRPDFQQIAVGRAELLRSLGQLRRVLCSGHYVSGGVVQVGSHCSELGLKLTVGLARLRGTVSWLDHLGRVFNLVDGFVNVLLAGEAVEGAVQRLQTQVPNRQGLRPKLETILQCKAWTRRSNLRREHVQMTLV